MVRAAFGGSRRVARRGWPSLRGRTPRGRSQRSQQASRRFEDCLLRVGVDRAGRILAALADHGHHGAVKKAVDDSEYWMIRLCQVHADRVAVGPADSIAASSRTSLSDLTPLRDDDAPTVSEFRLFFID